MDELVENAPRLDIEEYSEHKTVQGAIRFIVDDLIKPRQDRTQYWKNTRMLVISLWLAARASNNPWRSLSRDRNEYTPGSDYAACWITFGLVGIVDRLIKLGYIEQVNGKYNPQTGYGRKSRIRASDKLLDLIRIRDVYSVPAINPDVDQKTIVLKDEEKKVVTSFPQSGRTHEVHQLMTELNQFYANTRIEIDRAALKSDGFVQLTDKHAFRPFNNSDLWAGGRICGGVWQQAESQYRKTIKIDGEAVTELDYKANHPSMLYALLTSIPAPEDCYALPGYERGALKLAIMRMINNPSREKAIRSIRRGIQVENVKRAKKGKPLLSTMSIPEIDVMVSKLEELHKPIVAAGFYDGKMTYTLQNLEGEIATEILVNLMRQGICCLAVHDSFIVQRQHQGILAKMMVESYIKYLKRTPSIDIKY